MWFLVRQCALSAEASRSEPVSPSAYSGSSSWSPKLCLFAAWDRLLQVEQECSETLLCSQVVPMLPRLLCEELCSLNPMTDKLTFSVIWKLTPEGKVTNCTLSFILCLPLSHPVCHGKHPLCACTRLKFHNGWMQKVWGSCCREDILGLWPQKSQSYLRGKTDPTYCQYLAANGEHQLWRWELR